VYISLVRSRLDLSFTIDGCGADNEEMTIFWVGSAASPQILKDLFGVEDVYSVDPHMVRLHRQV